MFKLGIILYFIYQGRHPFEGETDEATLDNIENGEPEYQNADAPEELKEIIPLMISKDPDSRPTIEEL
jgi:serine/threonine protein kinase